MLIGEYEHSLDAKGRLIMPAKLRQDMGEKFIVTKGLDGCLFAFSQEEWLNFETKLKALPLSDRNARNCVRVFLSGSKILQIVMRGIRRSLLTIFPVAITVLFVPKNTSILASLKSLLK